MSLSRRAAIIWLVIVALFVQAAMPPMLHSVQGMTRGNIALEMCSMGGKKSITLPFGKSTPGNHANMGNCPCCIVPNHAAPPPFSLAIYVPPASHAALSTPVIRMVDAATWFAANPRAPPVVLI